MAKRSVEEIADIAAKWWAQKLIKPRFDMGAQSDQEKMLELFATVATKPVGEKQSTVFIDNIKEKIIKYLENHNTLCIDVDYAPCNFLAESMEVAGISMNNAPWKTTMWISKPDGEVSVKQGYGAGIDNLW